MVEVWRKLDATRNDNKKVDFEFLKDNRGKSADEIAEALRRSDSDKKLAESLRNAGCQDCSDAVTGRGTVNSNSKKLFDANNGDPDVPNMDSWYAQGGYPAKTGSQSWSDYFDDLPDTYNPFNDHHINPVHLFESSEGFVHYYQYYKGTDKLDFNAKGNLKNSVMVERYKTNPQTGQSRGVHTNHDKYEQELAGFYQKKWNDAKVKNAQFESIDKNVFNEKVANELHNTILPVTKSVKNAIFDKCIKGQLNINDLFNPSKGGLFIQDILTQY